MKKYLGIDPGGSGALVIIGENREIIEVAKMPDDFTDLNEFFKNNKGIHFAVLERVHGMPGMGGTAMFSFGKNYGHLEMALVSNEIPFETVTPQKWMKEYQLVSKKVTETKSEWKNRLKSVSVKLFPKIKVTLWNADALLIAEYCRRKY